MSDYDRDPEPVRDTERTTIIQTGGGERRGGGGIVIAIVLILALLVLAYLLFGGMLNRAGDAVGVNVNVDTPKIDMPDVNVKIPDKIEIPNVDVKTEKTETNQSR
jgi:hypothetical protein